MKILVGLFQPDDAIFVIRRLIENGFERDDLSMISTIKQVPTYLEEVESENAAVTGATVGAVTGSSVGILGSWAVSAIPGLESVSVAGFLMATAISGVVGGYLGSLYSVRADEQPKIDINDELASGKILVIVKIKDKQQAETAALLMEQTNGEHVNPFIIPDEKIENPETEPHPRSH